MSNEPTPTERLYAIVEQGLCIGCGLCQSVAGSDRVRVTKTMPRLTEFMQFVPVPGSKVCPNLCWKRIPNRTTSGVRGGA